jgi:hypothetical protein
MWVLIAVAYLEIALAFVASPQLAAMTPGKGVLLMIVSGGASVIQLPVIGWFTQIGLVAAAISKFFGAGAEPAMGCAATLLLVTFLGIVPIGLIWSRFEHVSLKSRKRASMRARNWRTAGRRRRRRTPSPWGFSIVIDSAGVPPVIEFENRASDWQQISCETRATKSMTRTNILMTYMKGLVN